MAEHNSEHTIALLARTPVALDGMLRGLPDEWTMAIRRGGLNQVHGGAYNSRSHGGAYVSARIFLPLL